MSDLIVYQPNPDISISLIADYAQHTIWATQKQISQALDLTVQAVSQQVQHFKKIRGAQANQAIKQLFITASDGKTYEVEHYNMTVIAFIGFRAQANERTLNFQDWVGEQLDTVLATQQTAINVLDPLDQLKMTVAILEQQRADMRLLQAEQAELKANQSQLAATVNDIASTFEADQGAPQLMTVRAYCTWRKLRFSDGELQSIGRKAKKYCDAHMLPYKEIPHAVYGVIKEYHIEALQAVTAQRSMYEGKK